MRIADGAGDLDLRRYVRPGDTVIWGQACAEPVPLTRQLFAQRADFGGIRCFLGIPATDTVRAEFADHVRFISYTGSGANRSLIEAGVLDVLPCHYSLLPQLFATRALPVDVALVQLTPAGPDGRYGLALAQEYLPAAIDAARVVIGEVNDQAPRVAARTLGPDELDVIVATSRPPAALRRAVPDARDERIGAAVAGLVADGSTLQLGIGALPEAIARQLRGHRDLGVHSGQIGDAVADLMESGVITGARKSIDAGICVTGLLMGSARLFDYADGHPGIALRGTDYTHDAAVLAGLDRFISINSALEVDLSGQLNAEVSGGRYVGAVGGALDFQRAAARSRGGLPIVAVRSTTRSSTTGPGSTIVAQLSGPATSPRADAGVIVTEFGAADLRGQPLSVRAERLIAIAHPDHRAALAVRAERILRAGPRYEASPVKQPARRP